MNPAPGGRARARHRRRTQGRDRRGLRPADAEIQAPGRGRAAAGDHDHQHGAPAPLDARGAPPGPGARRGVRRLRPPRDRLPAHGHREELRVPHLAAGRHAGHEGRLPVPGAQRARVLPRGRAPPRDRGPRSRAGAAGVRQRADPDRLAPGVARDELPGARGRLGHALRLSRARADPRHHGDDHRPSAEPLLHQGRRHDHGPARGRGAQDPPVPRRDARAHRRIRVDPLRQPDLAGAQPRRRVPDRRGRARAGRHRSAASGGRRRDGRPQGSPVQRVRDLRLRRRHAHGIRLLRALRGALRRDAGVAAHHLAVPRAPARDARADHGAGHEGRAGRRSSRSAPTASATPRPTSSTSWRSRWRPSSTTSRWSPRASGFLPERCTSRWSRPAASSASTWSPTAITVPYRVKIRDPSFSNLQAAPILLEGGLIADAIACIASMDPVMGGVDR